LPIVGSSAFENRSRAAGCAARSSTLSLGRATGTGGLSSAADEGALSAGDGGVEVAACGTAAGAGAGVA